MRMSAAQVPPCQNTAPVLPSINSHGSPKYGPRATYSSPHPALAYTLL